MDDQSSFYNKLSEAFSVGLDLPSGTDMTMLSFGQHKKWDSLGHMSLVTTLEETFGVSLTETEVLAIDSYTSAAEILRSRQSAGS